MTKLEEVAKAIYDRTWESPWDGLAPDSVERALSLEIARAAMEPLRKPYNPILKAGATALVQRRGGGPPDDEIDASRIFGRMIDAILNEKPVA